MSNPDIERIFAPINSMSFVSDDEWHLFCECLEKLRAMGDAETAMSGSPTVKERPSSPAKCIYGNEDCPICTKQEQSCDTSSIGETMTPIEQIRAALRASLHHAAGVGIEALNANIQHQCNAALALLDQLPQSDDGEIPPFLRRTAEGGAA